MASASTPPACARKDLILVHTVQLEPIIKVHEPGPQISRIGGANSNLDF